MKGLRAGSALLLAVALSACGAIPQRPARLEPSSYGCMAEVLRQMLPANLPESDAHCIASGLIARYCSPTEAYLAGAGKEMRDVFGRGDAAWSDWRADRAGIGCAYRSGDDEALAACCKETRSGRVTP